MGSSEPEDGVAIRATDAQRREIAAALDRAYADGRLDREEYVERTQIAGSARYVDDLRGLLFDLPGADVPLPPRRASPRPAPATPTPAPVPESDLAPARGDRDVPPARTAPRVIVMALAAVVLVAVVALVLVLSRLT